MNNNKKILRIVDVSIEEAKETAKEDIKKLKPYEVTPPDEYATGKKRRRIFLKQCYEKAFQYVSSIDNDSIKLVHGLYKPSFIESHVGHAWVEIPHLGIIFDGVLQRFYERDAYNEFYQCIKHNEYSCEEMFKIGYGAGGNYGPWENFVKGKVAGSNKAVFIASPKIE